MGKKEITRRDFVKITLGSITIFATGMTPLLSSIAEASGGKKSDLIKRWKRPSYKKNYCMVIVADRCIDCERCMEACRKGWKVPDYGYRTRVLEIKKDGHVSFLPVPCMQCDDPPCVHACPTGASVKRKEDGIITVTPYKCMGCKICMLACPYDARYFNEEKGAIDKCDFCLPRLQKGLKPLCVEACPTHARIFGDLNDKNSEVYKILSDINRQVRMLKEDLSTEPRVFYTHS